MAQHRLVADINGRTVRSMQLSKALGATLIRGGAWTKLPGGLNVLRQIHTGVYPKAFACEGATAIEASKAYDLGFMRVRLGFSMQADRNWAQWVELLHANLLAPLGLADATTCWNHLNLVTKRETAEHDMGISGRWHYDLHYPPTYFKIMVFLNGTETHGSGTRFLDPYNSAEVSRTTGYVGVTDSRMADLADIGFLDSSRITEVLPSALEAVIFWPARVMHQGIFPTGGEPRRVLSFSFMPSVVADRAQNLALYHEIAARMVKDADPPAFFE